MICGNLSRARASSSDPKTWPSNNTNANYDTTSNQANTTNNTTNTDTTTTTTTPNNNKYNNTIVRGTNDQ